MKNSKMLYDIFILRFRTKYMTLALLVVQKMELVVMEGKEKI